MSRSSDVGALEPMLELVSDPELSEPGSLGLFTTLARTGLFLLVRRLSDGVFDTNAHAAG